MKLPGLGRNRREHAVEPIGLSKIGRHTDLLYTKNENQAKMRRQTNVLHTKD